MKREKNRFLKVHLALKMKIDKFEIIVYVNLVIDELVLVFFFITIFYQLQMPRASTARYYLKYLLYHFFLKKA